MRRIIFIITRLFLSSFLIATSSCTSITSKPPTDIDPLAYYYKGFSYLREGKYDLAPSYFTKAVEAYSNRGLAHFEKGEYDRAIYNYNEAIGIASALADEEWVYYFKKMKFKEMKMLRIPTNTIAKVYYNRGVAYGTKGEFDRAISDFDSALEINPKNAETYYSRGLAYYNKGEFDRAISDFNRALEVNSGYYEAYINRGIAYDDKGESDRAIADFNRALEIDPRKAGAYCNRGIAYQRKGELDRALADFNRALEVNSGYAGTHLVYLNKAMVCEQLGRKKEAIEAYKTFIQYAPPQFTSDIERARQRIRELQ